MTIWPILVASLVGSPHCAAMCGLIAGAAGRRPAETVAYHGSRLVGYLTLGLAGGLVGVAAERLGAWAGLVGTATRVAGIALVLFGLAGILTSLGVGPGRWFRGGHGWVGRVAARGRNLPPLPRASLLGLVTALLPCGWLFAFVAVAAGTADPIRGAATMGAFWIGTVPAVVAAGFFISRLAGPLRARLPIVSGAVLVVFGLVTVLARPSQHATHAGRQPAAGNHGQHGR